jgi:5'(3')-deoxyribonucleotidase
MREQLDETNFLLYAAKHYDNPHCYDTLEFYDDLNRFKYIKRLFNRYEETGELKERLIVNHLIIIYNIFGAEPATRMLFLKLKGHYHLIKPFLVLMGYMPDVVFSIGIDGKNIISSDIHMDDNIVEMLRQI